MPFSAVLAEVMLKSASVLVPVLLDLGSKVIHIGGLRRRRNRLISRIALLRRILGECLGRGVIPLRLAGGTDRNVATCQTNMATTATLTDADGVPLRNLTQEIGTLRVRANLDCPLRATETLEFLDAVTHGTLRCLF